MIPFKKKKYRIKVPIDVYTSDNPINPPVGKEENGMDGQLNALSFTNKNPQMTQMVEIFGEGGDGSLVLEPKKIDFGIVKVNFNKMLKVTLHNYSHVTFYVELMLIPLDTTTKKFDAQTMKNFKSFFDFDFKEGLIAGHSKVEVCITFKP